jgi:hypothetical protein
VLGISYQYHWGDHPGDAMWAMGTYRTTVCGPDWALIQRWMSRREPMFQVPMMGISPAPNPG